MAIPNATIIIARNGDYIIVGIENLVRLKTRDNIFPTFETKAGCLKMINKYKKTLPDKTRRQ